MCKNFATAKILAHFCASFVIFSCTSLVGSCYYIIFYFIANGRTAYVESITSPRKKQEKHVSACRRNISNVRTFQMPVFPSSDAGD